MSMGLIFLCILAVLLLVAVLLGLSLSVTARRSDEKQRDILEKMDSQDFSTGVNLKKNGASL
jgi:hypothetical protein